MRPIQNSDGHVGLTSRNYPVAADTVIKNGQVVKLSGGLAVPAAQAETGAILGISGEFHSGQADAMNPRSNGPEVLVCDSPGLIFECHAPMITAASGTAETVVPRSGDISAALADDSFNHGVLVLVKKAAESANTDPIGVRLRVTDYAKSGTVLTKESGGIPSAGDVYELYPPLGSAVCGLDDARSELTVAGGGATSIRVIGHDFDRHMLRCMAALHTLAN